MDSWRFDRVRGNDDRAEHAEDPVDDGPRLRIPGWTEYQATYALHDRALAEVKLPRDRSSVYFEPDRMGWKGKGAGALEVERTPGRVRLTLESFIDPGREGERVRLLVPPEDPGRSTPDRWASRWNESLRAALVLGPVLVLLGALCVCSFGFARAFAADLPARDRRAP